MNHRSVNLIIICAILGLADGAAYKYRLEARSGPSPIVPRPWPETLPEQHAEPSPVKPEPEAPKVIEPVWTQWPRLREVTNLNPVLNDIDSHMPAGHQYRDSSRVTWAHETTHGINANIRNKHQSQQRVNGFYCLNDRAAVIVEPKTTIRAIAPLVPQGLRGPSYNLYLVSQASGWNDTPLYIFDEWVAYTNGSECGREINASGWYYELLQAHNFNIYAICLAMKVKQVDPDYDDKQLKAFIMWNIERTMRLTQNYVASQPVQYDPQPVARRLPGGYICAGPPLVAGDDQNPTQNAQEYIQKVRTLPEAEPIRKFCREYFGVEWCQRVYGF